MNAIILAAAAVDSSGDSLPGSLFQHLVAAAVFSGLGLIVFGAGIWIFNRFCPFSLRKELEEDQNVAVGIIVGAMMIGISIIIAAAIHG